MRRKIEEQKQEEVKKGILMATAEIIETEGFEGVSIRKIAERIGYSPGNIYQYFKGKDEIIGCLVQQGYQQILQGVKERKRSDANPEEEIKEDFIAYIKAALKRPHYYKAVMLNEEPHVLKRTGILARGVTQERETLRMLKHQIEKAIDTGRFKKVDPELTAQILWTSTFGLLIKLIIEKDIEEEQMDRLIHHHFEILFQGLLKEEMK